MLFSGLADRDSDTYNAHDSFGHLESLCDGVVVERGCMSAANWGRVVFRDLVGQLDSDADQGLPGCRPTLLGVREALLCEHHC